MKLTRLLGALVCALVISVVVAGCGGDSGVPGNAVATVDGQSIDKNTFNHWLSIAARQSGPTAQVPQPPDYKACIAEKRKQQPKPAKGQPTVTDAALKTQCQQQYEGLRDQVLQLLISFKWISGEADELKVKVTDAEVKKQFDTTKQQSFPKNADYLKFLKDSGQSEADILMRVRLDVLSNKIREAVVKGKDTVTPAQITTYYNKNKTRFAQPERRDLNVVLTKDEGKAKDALAQLNKGTAFKTVVNKFSIDQASKAQGGLLPSVAKGQQEKAFDDAIFKAEKGKLVGPVKTQFGYYVFKVVKITAASQQTEAQAKTAITQILKSQNEQTALDAFVKKFRSDWKGKTDCAKGYVTEDCKNYKKPKAGATGAAGAATGGAATTTVPAPATGSDGGTVTTGPTG